jgi:hypothetical protein
VRHTLFGTVMKGFRLGKRTTVVCHVTEVDHFKIRISFTSKATLTPSTLSKLPT